MSETELKESFEFFQKEKPKKRGGLQYHPVYKMKLRLSCPFCKKGGKPKIHHSLLSLNYHFASTHYSDVYCEKVISDLENLLKQGVLRE